MSMIRQTLKLTAPHMRSKDVLDFQTKLQGMGMYHSTLDGIYGPLSEIGCRAFQRSRGLKVDGICGKQTWAALDAALPPNGLPANPTVADIQARLIEWGFGTVVGAIDGKKGKKTIAGIKQFQSCMGLKPDGIVGKLTIAALWGEIIKPRITAIDMACQCVAAGKNYCSGYPLGAGYEISIRILAERIMREVEKKYPGTKFYIPTVETPSGSSIAGGNRCAKWNKERGGAGGSQHKACLAVDIWGVHDGTANSVIRKHIEDVALKMNIYGGVGYGAAYIVHIDTRGTAARWKY